MDLRLGLYLCVISLAINAALTISTVEPTAPTLSDTSATDNSTETTTTAPPTTTVFEDTQTGCRSGLQKCQDTFYNSDKNRKQALILVDCVEAVVCEGSDDDVALKHHTLLTCKTDALHWDTDDEGGRSRALVANAGLDITLVISLAATLALITV